MFSDNECDRRVAFWGGSELRIIKVKIVLVFVIICVVDRVLGGFLCCVRCESLVVVLVLLIAIFQEVLLVQVAWLF